MTTTVHSAKFPSSLKHTVQVKTRGNMCFYPVIAWETNESKSDTILYVLDANETSGARKLIVATDHITDVTVIDEKKEPNGPLRHSSRTPYEPPNSKDKEWADLCCMIGLCFGQISRI